MKKIIFFVVAIPIGFAAVYFYFKLQKTDTAQTVQIKIPFVGSQFSLEEAPSQSLKGKIISSSGNIGWQSRIATEESKLKQNIEIQQGESVSTKEDGNITIQFGDNTTISLHPKTKVDIIQTLSNDMVFNQASGSATYVKSEESPVSIRAAHLLIENGGTVSITFNDQNKSLVSVEAVSGTSKIAFNDSSFTSNIVTITKEQIYIFNDDNRQGDLE